MDDQRDDPEDFLGRMYRRLVGATVTGFKWDGEFPTFTVRLANGKTREIGVQQDAEGNGPGFLAGID